MSKRHFAPPTRAQTDAGRGAGAPRERPQDNVRAAAAWVLERTLQSLAPADSFLDSTLPRFDDRDQGLLRELVMGSLRWLRRLDHIIAAASNRSFSEIEAPLHAPLRVAVYQLLFLDRVPAHAAVHEAVEQANQVTHRGGASFVNAVLRRIARAPRLEDWPVEEPDRVRRLAIEKSHPDFLVARWLERFGTRPHPGAAGMPTTAPSRCRFSPSATAAGASLLAEALIDEGMEVEPATLSPLGLIVRRGNPLTSGAFLRGELYVQDEGQPGRRPHPAAAPGRDHLRRRRGAGRQELLPARRRAAGEADSRRRLAGPRRRAARQPAAAAAAPAAAGAGRRRHAAVHAAVRPRHPRPAVHRHGDAAPASGDQVADQRRGRSAACRARPCVCWRGPRRWWRPAACWWPSPARWSARRTRT